MNINIEKKFENIRAIIFIIEKNLPTSGVEPPTFRLQGERNNHYATQAFTFWKTRKLFININMSITFSLTLFFFHYS